MIEPEETKGQSSSTALAVSNSAILGEVTWLLSHSTLHQEWPIGSIQQWVLPAVLHKQFRIYRQNGKPIGYVSWAWLSKDVEEAYVLNTSSLQPKDWKSGDRGWVIDFVTPFGSASRIARDLKTGIFKNDVGRSLRVRPGSDTIQIQYLHGANAVEKARNREFSPTVELASAALK